MKYLTLVLSFFVLAGCSNNTLSERLIELERENAKLLSQLEIKDEKILSLEIKATELENLKIASKESIWEEEGGGLVEINDNPKEIGHELELFEKNKECFAYKSQVKEEISENFETLHSIFYSPKVNSCVYKMTSVYTMSNANEKWISDSLKDVFTNEVYDEILVEEGEFGSELEFYEALMTERDAFELVVESFK